MEKQIAPSELIINSDGSVFHLHVKPEMLADNIILVGDPARVNLVASFFDEITGEVSSREFHTISGVYKGKPIMCTSHGIGADNIDIVVNELDALANIDFNTRTVKKEFRQLSMVRIGTSGSIQEDIPVGAMVVSRKSLGIDGAFHFYKDSEKYRDIEMENAFIEQCKWKEIWNHPYIVDADTELADRLQTPEMFSGVTITANGFYGPQGRELRLPLADPEQNAKIEAFRYGDLKVTNFEMESSAVAGLSRLMGHRALTCCMVIANRLAGRANPNYKNNIDTLIATVLDRI